jgi:hypothetical protein
MAIRITETRMDSDITPEFATWDEAAQAWRVSWLPGKWTRTQATTAMVIAEHQARGDYDSPHITAMRAQLGIGQ